MNRARVYRMSLQVTSKMGMSEVKREAAGNRIEVKATIGVPGRR